MHFYIYLSIYLFMYSFIYNPFIPLYIPLVIYLSIYSFTYHLSLFDLFIHIYSFSRLSPASAQIDGTEWICWSEKGQINDDEASPRNACST